MSARVPALLAWSIFALSVVLLALTGLLGYLTPPSPTAETGMVFGALFVLLSVTYPTVGALIASRRPRNAVGWLYCAAGLLIVGTGCATAYTEYSLSARPELLPATQYTAWFVDTSPAYYGAFLILALLLLLYPDGRLLSRGWGVVIWVVVIGCATWAVGWATEPGPLYSYGSIDNPLAIGGNAGAVLGKLGPIGILLAFLGWAAAGISWAYRWDRAEGEERQQIKWFAFNLLLIVASLAYPWFLTPLAFALLPVTTGIAIFRHHLYDMDRIINRTLVYGSLTGILALVYLGGVTATQALLQAFTGQEELPQLVIVASTLAIAALFSPLRRRVQSFVDRRFYRSKYDARKTLEAYSTKLRDETDLEALNSELVGVVRETVQPAHVSMWWRPDAASNRRQAD
jgi:MFS family permease